MIWLVSARGYDYDEYDSFVVRAKSGEEAIELVRGRFEKSQLPLSVEKVSVGGKADVILGSFNAG